MWQRMSLLLVPQRAQATEERFGCGLSRSQVYSGSVAEPAKENQDLQCDECGKFGAYAFDTKNLCTDCYALRCSCCPEFGKEE